MPTAPFSIPLTLFGPQHRLQCFGIQRFLRYDTGAAAYDRPTGRWSRMYVDRALDVAGVSSGKRVLEVATGTGDAAIIAADRVGDLGRVVAIDITEPMLREARTKAGERSIEFAQADAQQLSFPDASFDSIVCLFGVMFIPDKAAALRGFRRLLRPGGRATATSWDQATKAPFAELVAQALAEELPMTGRTCCVHSRSPTPMRTWRCTRRPGLAT